MRKIFRNINGELIKDEIQYSLEIIKDNPGARVYIGSDSQKHRKGIEFATVIAYRYGSRGCHFIYNKWKVPRGDYGRGEALIRRRLQEEIQCTTSVAKRLTENSVKVYQVDFDLNGNPQYWRSNQFIYEASDWAHANGLQVAVKPDELVAAKAANQLIQ